MLSTIFICIPITITDAIVIVIVIVISSAIANVSLINVIVILQLSVLRCWKKITSICIRFLRNTHTLAHTHTHLYAVAKLCSSFAVYATPFYCLLAFCALTQCIAAKAINNKITAVKCSSGSYYYQASQSASQPADIGPKKHNFNDFCCTIAIVVATDRNLWLRISASALPPASPPAYRCVGGG